jgi:hypothetical protein
LNPDDLKWQQLLPNPGPLQLHLAEQAASYGGPLDATEGKGASLTAAIGDAKRKLAESLGIAAEKIEITIRL